MILTPSESRGLRIDTRPEQPILVSGLVGSEMDTESKFGQMVPVMKATGKIIEHKEQESLLISMVTSMKEIGLTTRQMVMVYTFMLTELGMRATGWMIYSTAWAKNHGQMVPSMRVSTSLVKNTVEVSTAGTMALSITVIGRKIRSKDLERTPGSMEDSTRENGLTTIWTVLEFILGKTEDHTVGSIKMTRSMDTVSTHGLMAELTLVTGAEASNMVLELISCQINQPNVVFGKKEKESNGSMKISNQK